MNDKETMVVIAGTVQVILWAMDELDEEIILSELREACPKASVGYTVDEYKGILGALEIIKKYRKEKEEAE